MREIWGLDVQRTIKSHGKRLIRIRPWGTQADTPSDSAGDATGGRKLARGTQVASPGTQKHTLAPPVFCHICREI